MAEQEKFSIAKPFVYLALCGYLTVVVYPMLWLLYTSLKTDREIFLNPFQSARAWRFAMDQLYQRLD